MFSYNIFYDLCGEVLRTKVCFSISGITDYQEMAPSGSVATYPGMAPFVTAYSNLRGAHARLDGCIADTGLMSQEWRNWREYE